MGAEPIRVALAGSTGSIGTQSLDVIEAEPERYRVTALAAGSSVELLAEQANRWQPEVVAIADESKVGQLRELLRVPVEVIAGADALADSCGGADVVINGVVGFAGLPVTLAAINNGARLGLANKESLIAAGPVVARARETSTSELVPVDSEHCAVHQCLRSNDIFTRADVPDRLSRIVLTASGGPFRGRSKADLAEVSIDDALAHPTWSMGPKITIDSSTLMNKGLEVIEAHELFGATYDQIEVVVHPQSVIHSMVEWSDGATIAQLSMPDMRLPIGYALAYPDRIATPFGRIDWAELSRLDFEPPDLEAFPCLGLAYTAGRLGETAPAWLNAANEVAVQAFLDGAISWVGISETLKKLLDLWPGTPADSLDAVLDADARARAVTQTEI